jgi:hypothetical protein
VLSLGHNYIDTEHILLDFDADDETVRDEIIRMLSAKRALRAPSRPDTACSRRRGLAFQACARVAFGLGVILGRAARRH